MTEYQKSLLERLQSGKPYFEIAKALKIQPQSLYNAVWRLRQKGIDVHKPKSFQPKRITPAQRKVLEMYAKNIPVPEIAKALSMRTQTVWNHANCGFRRLNLIAPGVDRIAAIPAALVAHDALHPKEEQKPKPRITMDDPFFN